MIAIEGNGIRPSHLGSGFSVTDTMYTLNTVEQHCVCFSIDCRNLRINLEKSGTLQAKENGGVSLNYTNPVFAVTVDNAEKDKRVVAVYDARGNGKGDIAPTITGIHNSTISDYTAVAVLRRTK